MKPRILIIVGTRPEIIKMAPVIRAIEEDPGLDLAFVSSGQHYDYELSRKFIEELELPTPDLDLHVGSGSHAEQTAFMLREYETVFRDYGPDVVLVEGDTNTVVAAGLAAIKLQIPLGHVEAGLRSYDRTMPEEINRRIADICAELHFAPTEKAAINLLHEGVLPHRIFITGNTIVDACFQHLKIANHKSRIMNKLGLTHDQRYAVVTVHRPENVDNKPKLKKIVKILLSIQNCKLVFPLHPRTRKMMERFGLNKELKTGKNILCSKPLGYLDFLKLLSNSSFVLTDSGGIQEESATLKIPCLTLRNNTERPETIEMGVNRLVGLNFHLIKKYVHEILYNPQLRNLWNTRNPYGDGTSGRRIVQLTKSACLKGLKVTASTFLKKGLPGYKLLKVDKNIADKTIKEISQMNQGSIVLIYDHAGKPCFPNSQDLAKKGSSLLLFQNYP